MGSRTNITAFDKHHFQLSSSSLTSFAIRKRRRPPKFSPSAVFLPPPPRGCRLTRHVRQDAISKKVLLSGWVRVFPFLFLFPFPSFAGGKSPPIETRFFAARLIYFFLSLSVPSQCKSRRESFSSPALHSVLEFDGCLPFLSPASNQYSSHLSRHGSDCPGSVIAQSRGP